MPKIACILVAISLPAFWTILPRQLVSEEIAYETPNIPLLLQFCQQADLIIVGRVVNHSGLSGNRITELETERIIASIWDEEETMRHFKEDSNNRRITVVENRSIMIMEGKYLCWLELRTGQADNDSIKNDYFVPVKVATGFDSSESGIASLKYLDEMITEEDYTRLENTGGIKVDLRALSDQRMQALYETTDRQQLVHTTSQCAKLMLIGKDANPALDLFSQSQEGENLGVIKRLLGLGEKAKRFRFVDTSER